MAIKALSVIFDISVRGATAMKTITNGMVKIKNVADEANSKISATLSIIGTAAYAASLQQDKYNKELEITGRLTDEQIAKTKEQQRELSKQGLTMQGVGEAQIAILKGGGTFDQLEEIAPAVAMLAKVKNIGATEAWDAIRKTMIATGKDAMGSADMINNAMTALGANASGKLASIVDVGQKMGKGGTEQMIAATVDMQKKGFEDAAENITGIMQTLQASGVSNKWVRDILKNGKATFSEVLDALKDLNPKQLADALGGDIRQVDLTQQLIANRNEIEKNAKVYEDAAKEGLTLQDDLARKNEGLAASFERLIETAKRFFTEFANITGWLANMVSWANSLLLYLEEIIGKYGEIAGKIANFVKIFSAVLLALKVITMIAGAIATAIGAPFALIAIGIAAAIGLIYTFWDEIKAFGERFIGYFSGVAERWKEIWGGMANFAIDAMMKIPNAIKGAFDGVSDKLKGLFGFDENIVNSVAQASKVPTVTGGGGVNSEVNINFSGADFSNTTKQQVQSGVETALQKSGLRGLDPLAKELATLK